MNINQTNSPTFSAVIRTGNLNSEQKVFAHHVTDIVTPSREYKWASDRKFDIFLVKPTRKDGILRAVYFDNKMGTFVRGANGRFLDTLARSKNAGIKNYQITAQRIQNTLIDIINGKYKAPYWYNDPNKYGSEKDDFLKRQEKESE